MMESPLPGRLRNFFISIPTKPKTLFATHYHELNEMTHHFERIRNYNVSVKEVKNNIIFLRKLVEGGSEHSFGIHVAKMAGMPSFVVAKAEGLLKKLEASRSEESNAEKLSGSSDQLSFFQLDDPLLDEMRKSLETLDINTLTPVEALVAQLVEHDLAKVGVAGSNPVSRSFLCPLFS